ncbi:MAG: exodeoxyribonuclease VII large subunit [Saprospiraceae bacterium]|nr:exodeoxyribonuclease VII large subunit [Saprospiraceae bacterium]
MAQNDTFTLFDLNEYLKRVIALNFPEPVWISCEIAQIKNARGNYYLDLVQQNEKEEVIAQSQAAIWYKSYLFLKAKLGDLLNSLLQEGTQIKIKVNVEYNERFGLKLIIEDIDPAYTLGQMELSRQKIMERLKTAGVTELNKNVVMPRVIQRIAVISSDTAAGFKDFTAHLEENKYGYQFTPTLFPAAMQGQNTEKEVVSQLQEIKLQNKTMML